MFKQITGARAWVLGIGGFVGVVSGVMTYVQLAEQIIPREWARFLPVGMIAGFALALWAVGTTEQSTTDGVLYRESIRLREENAKLREHVAGVVAKQDTLAAELASTKPREIDPLIKAVSSGT